MSTSAPEIALPSMSLTVHSTRSGFPLGSAEMDPPFTLCTASWVWNGPSTVPSVPPFGFGWSMESTSKERPRMSERRMNSWRQCQRAQLTPVSVMVLSHLSDIRTNLSYFGQKEQGLHPFVCAEPGFSGEIVQVYDYAFQDESQPQIGACRIDCVHVVRDVLDR